MSFGITEGSDKGRTKIEALRAKIAAKSGTASHDSKKDDLAMDRGLAFAALGMHYRRGLGLE